MSNIELLIERICLLRRKYKQAKLRQYDFDEIYNIFNKVQHFLDKNDERCKFFEYTIKTLKTYGLSKASTIFKAAVDDHCKKFKICDNKKKFGEKVMVILNDFAEDELLDYLHAEDKQIKVESKLPITKDNISHIFCE